MNDTQRLQLSKMIKTNDVEDVTSDIRDKKHSILIEKDIDTMIRVKGDNAHLALTDEEQYNTILSTGSPFLYENYTDIFNRIKKDELDLTIMHKFIGILRNIELGEIDQHEGAYMVGKYLKEIYIDSAMKRGEKLDKEYSTSSDKSSTVAKEISWTEYKQMNVNC